MIDTDFSWTLRVYPNHLRSIVYEVCFLRITQLKPSKTQQHSGQQQQI
jgi:hypothetical protein